MMQSVALTESSLNYHQQHVEHDDDDDYVLVGATAAKTESSSVVLEGTGSEEDFDDEASYDYCEDALPGPSAGLSPSSKKFLVDSPPRQQVISDFVSTKTTTPLPPDLSETDVEDALGALEIGEIEDLEISDNGLRGFLVPGEEMTKGRICSDKDKRISVSHMPDSVHDEKTHVSCLSTAGEASGLRYSCSPSTLRSNLGRTPADDDTVASESKSTVSTASSSTKATARLGRLSNKKRRKQMKISKKAAAAAAAAAALSHMRTLTTRTSPSSPPHRNRTKIAPTPSSSTKKNKQVAPAAAIARRTLTSYKREVAANHHRAATPKVR